MFCHKLKQPSYLLKARCTWVEAAYQLDSQEHSELFTGPELSMYRSYTELLPYLPSQPGSMARYTVTLVCVFSHLPSVCNPTMIILTWASDRQKEHRWSQSTKKELTRRVIKVRMTALLTFLRSWLTIKRHKKTQSAPQSTSELVIRNILPNQQT